MNNIFNDFNQLAKQALDHVRQDMATLRTGKASAQMLDPVSVEAYGTMMKINEVANVSAPDPNLIVVQPWDGSLVEAIEKGIAKAGLNLSPVVDGQIIRVQVPPLTEERRKEMVKLLYKKIEAGRVMLRSIRTDTKQIIEDQEGNDNVSEDDIRRQLKELDELTQKYVEELEITASEKEASLMTV